MPHALNCQRFLAAAAAVATVLVSAARAAVHLPQGFVVEVVSDSDLSEPMDLAFAPDGAAWVTGRAGDVWRVDTAARATRRVGGIETDTTGDRGLHGIAFHPDFPASPYLYFAYHAPGHPLGKYRGRIARWTLAGEGRTATLDPDSEKTLLEWEGFQNGQHVGGGLLVHPVERLLYATIGDNNKIAELKRYADDPANQAQSLADVRGKVIRMGLDGSIPSDNPYARTAGANGLIFTRGSRQPWLLNFDRPSGLLLLAENGGDEVDDHEEVNRVSPGANFGWPKVFGDGWLTTSRTNRDESFTAPWFMYRRNTGASCTGAVIYRPPAVGGGFPKQYHGSLFYADFVRKSIRSAPVDPLSGKPGPNEAFAQGLDAGPVSLRLGPDGALYFIQHGGATKASTNDALARIVWKP